MSNPTPPAPSTRSVCERLLAWNGIDTRSEPYIDLLRDARLAIGQPDSDALDALDAATTQLKEQGRFVEELRGMRDDLSRKLADEKDLSRTFQEQCDELRADVRSLTQQLDAANKRAENAEAKLRELESVSGKLISQHGDIHRKHAEQLGFLAGWLLDQLIERGSS